ncbi:MAG: dihydroneopterin aldolase [Legionellales bacterium]|nr:dihydroneopterin aldolase [Legionellales bacterium]
MAKLTIDSLELTTIIGVLPFERQIKQKLWLDVCIHLDITEASAHDDLNKTLNYASLAEHLQKVAATSSDELIETFVMRLKEAMIQQYPQILAGKLILHKKGALPKARSVSIEIEW